MDKTTEQYSQMLLWFKKHAKFQLYIIPLSLLVFAMLFKWQVILALYIILNIFYLAAQSFKLFLVLIALIFKDHKQRNTQAPEEWPIYSILLPVYKEAKIFKNLVKSIKRIDYPAKSLDVKILIEEDDLETLKLAKSIDLPAYFEIVEIPLTQPRTKPKACNYGLKYAKGKYIVVFDAEDYPNPIQLKQVVMKFMTLPQNVICIQARLNYYNRNDNLLTKFCAFEYSLFFDYMIAGLQKLDMPIPLGGTSNHFIKDKLLELGGWDAYNVTEDADLGIKLYNQGYRCVLGDFLTKEEAPISLKGWLKQRSRWIKGHILTSFLYLNSFRKMSLRAIIGVVFLLYIPNLTYILLPIYLLLKFIINVNHDVDLLFYSSVLVGVIAPILSNIIVLIDKKWQKMKLALLLFPLYYLLFPLAAIRSCWQIFTKPFYWDKTEHGLCDTDQNIEQSYDDEDYEINEVL